MSKATAKKELQFITDANGVKIEEITDTLKLDGHKHNARLVKDYKDGRLLVEHSVFSDNGKTFLGNVKTTLFDYGEDGKKRFIEEVESTPAKADKIIFDRNRQALQDAKNELRGELTRQSTAKPETRIARTIRKTVDVSALTEAQRQALEVLGVDPDSLS